MRIECQSCSAKYQVADEKVVGKLFKVRCKKCGAMISVDGTNIGGDESEEATRVYDMNQGPPDGSDEAAEEPAGIWYAVIDGEQSGPFTEAEVEERVSSSMLDADSFVWCDGMGDWERLADNDTFAHLFESAAAPVAAPAAKPLGGSAAAQQVESFPSGGYGAISGGARPGAFASAAGAAKSGSDDIFSRAPAPSSAAAEDDDSMVGARSENSVLFSLDSLTDVRSGGAAAKADVPRTEESGLINLEALISTRNQQSAAGDDSFGGAGAGSAGPAISMGAGPALPRPTERSKTAVIVLSIAAVLVVALLAAIIFILLSSKDETPAVAEAPAATTEETAAATPPTQEEPAAAAPEEDGEDDEGEEETVVEVEEEPEETPEQVAEAEAARQAAGGTAPARTQDTRTETAQREASTQREPARTEQPATRTPPRETAQEDTRSGRDRSGGGVDSVLQRVRGGGEEEAAPARTAPSRPAASSLPERLERSDIQNAVRRYSSRLARCKASDDEAGTYRTRFVIQPSGSVTNAAVDNDNATGRCILGVVRDFSFPRFSGDPIPVANYPIPIN